MHARISVSAFWLPAAVLALILLGVASVPYAFVAAVLIGVIRIISDSIHEIREGKYSLDYIAFVAMVVSVIAGNPVAGAIVALMFTGGKALEDFASNKAYAALKSLSENIPKNCFVMRDGTYIEAPIQDIKSGETILVKKNEVVPLDGTVHSICIFNLANLTGEAEPQTFAAHTLVKSGAINAGDTAELTVVGNFSSSTYHKIVQLVEEAKAHPARIVRLSEKANFWFTLVSFGFASGAFLLSGGELGRALAVLVIATPCPLIIAAPVAFIGGMSRLASRGIIMRKPAAFESIGKAGMIFFDKTGTLTMGEPTLVEITVAPDDAVVHTEAEALAVAAAIEIHSLHPLARAVLKAAKDRNIAHGVADMAEEQLGKGISGRVNDREYSVGRFAGPHEGIVLALSSEGKEVAQFHFVDTLKEGAPALLTALNTRGVRTAIITGDKKENAERVFGGIDVDVYAETSPEDKYNFIEDERKKGVTVAMVGDGLNDAPALARADVGIVFSGTENGASIEAADVVILGFDIASLAETFAAANRTIQIAKQSIYGGIILSCIGMAFAALGFIPPVTGAFIQEAIDVIVILNALRTLRG